MDMRPPVIIFVAIAGLLLGRATSQAERGPFELAGTFWRIDSLAGTTDDSSNVVVYISKSLVRISVPCLAVGYPYRYEHGSLTIVPSPASRSSCRDIVRSHAIDVIEANLSGIAGSTIDAEALTFLDDRNRSIMKVSRLNANGLENQQWSIDQYFDGTQLVASTGEPNVTFFNNIIDGSPGCGGLFGGYRLSGANLQISASWILGGYCPGDYRPQNEAIIGALSGERSIERDNERILLRDAQGKTRLVLTRRAS